MTDLSRLTRGSEAGDTDAARRLLVAAKRAGDVDVCMLACRILVASGEWREPLAYYSQRVEDLIEIHIGCDCEGCLSPAAENDPIDCHDLCNAIAQIGRMDCIDTWLRAIQLWYPAGWFDLIATRKRWISINDGCVVTRPTTIRFYRTGKWESFGSTVPPLPTVPECICLGAGVDRGLCPLCSPSPCSSPFASDGNRCPQCNGSGRCPRCVHIVTPHSDLEFGQVCIG